MLAHIGKNRSCGEEDALEGKVHQNSAICHSSTAEVLAVESEEFLRVLHLHQDYERLEAFIRLKGSRYAERFKAKNTAEEGMLESKKELNKTMLKEQQKTKLPERFTKPFAKRAKPSKNIKVEMPKIKRAPTQIFIRSKNNTEKGLQGHQLKVKK